MIDGTTIRPYTSFAQAVADADSLLHNRMRAFRSSAGIWDDLGYQIDGETMEFVTTYSPIDQATLIVMADGKAATVGSINADTGEFSLQAPPAETLKAKYHYQPLADVDVQTCVTQAVLRLQRYNDITAVPIGLYPAIQEYIKALGKKALARKFTERINVRLGPRGEDWAAIAASYDRQAEEEFKLGDEYRDQFYKRAGQRYAPAATVTGPFVLDPFTPRR